MFQRRHHLHLIHFHFKRGLSELYVCNILRQLAFAAVGLFVPIYFLTLGLGLKDIAVFYLSASLSYILFVIPAARFSANRRLKLSMALSIIPLLTSFAMLYTLGDLHWPVYLIGAIFGLNWPLFWFGFYVNLAIDTDKDHQGEEIGIMYTFIYLVEIFSPVIGATILSFFGFHVLFLFVALVLALSIIPLFYSDAIVNQTAFDVKKIWPLLKTRNAIGFCGFGGEDHGAGGVIWPVFMFLAVPVYLALGLIFSVGLAAAVVFSYITSELTDKIKKQKMIYWGATTNSIFYLLRTFANTVVDFLSFNLIAALSSILTRVPVEALVFEKANQKSLPEFIVAKEIAFHFGAVIFFTLIFIVNDAVFGLILGAIFSLLYLFMK